MGLLRDSKKRATRQRISDVATDLFHKRGFDDVTVDEIAILADVSKMTVFNYFPRKEELFFDRAAELEQILASAIPPKLPPVDALRALVDRLRAAKHPFARIDAQTAAWWRVVAASPSLQSHLRRIGDDIVDRLATEIAGPKPDAPSRLLAGMVIVTWRTAYAEGLRLLAAGASSKRANTVFLSLIDRGFTAIRAVSDA